MHNILIDSEFQAIIPPLSAEERAQLEANLLADGCRDPLVVWPCATFDIRLDGGATQTLRYEDGRYQHAIDEHIGPTTAWDLDDNADDDRIDEYGDTITLDQWPHILIDGHNRYEICTRLGLPFEVVQKEFESRVHARIWMRQLQRGRRNLSDAWLIDLALGDKADLLTLGSAKIAQSNVERTKQEESHFITNDKVDLPKHNTQKEVAKAAGVSTGQIAKAEIVKREAPDLWEKAKAQELTIGAAYTQIKKVEKQQAREAAIAVQTQTAKTQPTLEQADAIEWLARQEPCDLLLTDPPYSTDVTDIQAFAKSWLPLALSKVKPTGRAFIFIGAYPAELAAYLATAMPEQVLVWTYRNTLGPSPSHNYKLNWQAILYFKGPEAGPLDCPVMLEQFSVQDISAPDGRQGDRYHAWQKPLEIADRFVRHATKPGDVVLDPFACTGTFLIAAAALGREAKGCDISAENIAIAEGRGCLTSNAI